MQNKARPIAAGFGFLAIVCVLCALCVGEILLSRMLDGKSAVAVAADVTKKPLCIVIDPGHGGIDGGASEDGVIEKELNLSVAMKLAELCRATGIDCILTRCDDRLVVDDSVTERRKLHDLKNRVAIAESQDGAVFVSIHMNRFPDSRYSGLQVWYSPHDESSRSLAALIRGYSATYLSQNKPREIKSATSAIYVLDRLHIPAVLVECGFLSNPDERALLASDEYRSKLAAMIFASIVEYSNLR